MLMAYPCMYTYNKVKFSLLFWVVSSVHLGDVAECSCGSFSNCTVHIHTGSLFHQPGTQTPSGAGLGTPLIVPLMCAISLLSSMGAKIRASRSGTWLTVLPSISFTIIASGLCGLPDSLEQVKVSPALDAIRKT